MIFILCRQKGETKMAVLFNQDKFVTEILKEAEQRNLLEQVKDELELFKKNNLVEYLFWVHELTTSIKRAVFKYPLIRMAGATSICAYVLGIHGINPIKYDLSNKFFFQRHYKYNLKPRFDISVPKSKREDVIALLETITESDVELYTGGIYCFGKNKEFEIGIYGSNYLEKCISAYEKDEISQKWLNSDNYDPRIIDYMLEQDKRGYYLPNLTGCIATSMSRFYKYMEAGKPKNLDELAMLISIDNSVFKDDKLVIKSLKKNGFEDTICSREQVLSILNRYDIDESRTLLMIDTLLAGDDLFESDKMLLESNEVPKHIIEQLENVKYLGYYSFALQEVVIAYKLAHQKYNFTSQFEKLFNVQYPDSFVGPFFYINKRLYSHKEALSCFHPFVRFFDDPISHFDYFETLNIDGDYGNYPRGRVIYDNYHRQFIVYFDKSLDNEPIKGLIEIAYGIVKERVVYRRDSHYTHDGL